MPSSAPAAAEAAWINLILFARGQASCMDISHAGQAFPSAAKAAITVPQRSGWRIGDVGFWACQKGLPKLEVLLPGRKRR